MPSLYAQIAVADTAYSFDSLFCYKIPDTLALKAEAGVRVVVPFGRGNIRREGMIFSVSPQPAQSGAVKEIVSLLDDKPVLSGELLEMTKWLAENTFCTYYDAVKAVLPPAMRYREKSVYSLSCKQDGCELTLEEISYLHNLPTGEKSAAAIEATYPENREIVDSLIIKGVILKSGVLSRRGGDYLVKSATLTNDFSASPDSFSLTAKQKTVVSFLAENGSASVREICLACCVTDAVVKKLEKTGAVVIFDEQRYRSAYSATCRRDISSIVLSEHQSPVFERIALFIRSEEKTPKAFLLHGVTGSGKTAVYARLINETILRGRGVIFLVPEISLTPQMSDYFVSLFGERVAMIHSGLSIGKRLDEYNRIKNKLADIVIGTRSAIFAPLSDIGLIIMDEEGEKTYKSESSPRYSTVSVARQRCKTHNAVLLLASATPTIESYYLAKKGVYELLTLSERFSRNLLPQTQIVDMAEQTLFGKFMSFSEELKSAVEDNLRSGNQTILLLNRRGYHSIITCTDCHKAIFCKNCSVPMTYHKIGNSLVCHYCGHTMPFTNSCPDCGGTKLRPGGFGTQKLEEEVAELFPSARILRMDADVTAAVGAYEKSFDAFSRGEYDILLGTQMIGKGLDFPNVTLVGVLSVDKALFTGDFKSFEHSFSLITQVIGRSGRGEKPGRAILQTYLPDHYVLNLAAEQNYEEFYSQEIAVRKAFLYPPVCDLCVLGFSSRDEDALVAGVSVFIEVMKRVIDEDKPEIALRVLGPAKFGVEKVDGRFRRRIILKCKNNPTFRSFLSKVIRESGKCKELSKITLYADVNGEAGY